MTLISKPGPSTPDDKNAYIPYVLPFAVFGVFIIIEAFSSFSMAVLYPLKTVTVGWLLWIFRKKFIREITVVMDFSAVLAGMLVFIIWIGLDGYYPVSGSVSTLNPFEAFEGWVVYLFVGFRITGAVLVVPVMEELFWRSFALRFLISSKFQAIPPGTFTWFSFIMTSVAFGFEHYHWLPGIIAGFIYALLWYQKKNLFSPIIAHAVTNLLLALYVLSTGEWSFW